MDFELSRTVFDDLWCRSKMNSHRSLELSCRQVQHKAHYKAHYKAHFSTFHRDVVLCRWKLDIAWCPRLEGLMRLCSRWTAGSAFGSEAVPWMCRHCIPDDKHYISLHGHTRKSDFSFDCSFVLGRHMHPWNTDMCGKSRGLGHDCTTSAAGGTKAHALILWRWML